MKICALLTLLLIVAGCAHRASRTLVLSYSDFGPQAAAYPVIGYEWYQWQTHGDSRPQSRDDIRVVVYDGDTLAHVESAYPVVQNKRQDYRYLSLRDAVAYLDAHSHDLPSLATTRERLISHFGYQR